MWVQLSSTKQKFTWTTIAADPRSPGALSWDDPLKRNTTEACTTTDYVGSWLPERVIAGSWVPVTGVDFDSSSSPNAVAPYIDFMLADCG